MNRDKKPVARILCALIAAGILSATNFPAPAIKAAAGSPDLFTSVKAALLGTAVIDKQAFESSDSDGDLLLCATDASLILRKLLKPGAGTDPTGENNIYLADSGITFTGTGMELSDNSMVITITQPGDYNVSGSTKDGQIIINVDKTVYAGEDDKVKLQLCGIDLTCPDNSPIFCAAINDKLIIDLSDGSTNYITDGTGYTNADSSAGAIYSKDDLNIKGSGGTLIVKGNTEDAIVCKDDLKIKSGTIDITSADDGMRGKDSVEIEDGTIKINAAGAGIKSSNDTEEGEGNVLILGGTIDITCGVYSGNTATGKGIVGYSSVTVEDGTLNINSADDALHSNNTVTVNGGNITIATKDDALHADEYLTINGGAITATESYEGLEACYITINDGTIKLKASDDGINAAGGDGSGMMGPGQGGWNPGGSSNDYYVKINGGYLYVESNGDGLDSNGSLYITGGVVIECGPVRGGNGMIDIGDGSGYTFSVTGGLVMTIGTSDMAVMPTSDFGYLYSSGMKLTTGTMVCVADASGNCIAALQVPASINNMTGACEFSASTYVNGTHSIYLGGTYSGTLDANGFATSGVISGATKQNNSTGGGGGWWGF